MTSLVMMGARKDAGPPPGGRGGPAGSAGSGSESRQGDGYLMILLASATALSRASFADTLLNSADWIALLRMSLTSALWTTNGTMSWYVPTVSLASERPASSIAVAGVE